MFQLAGGGELIVSKQNIIVQLFKDPSFNNNPEWFVYRCPNFPINPSIPL